MKKEEIIAHLKEIYKDLDKGEGHDAYASVCHLLEKLGVPIKYSIYGDPYIDE